MGMVSLERFYEDRGQGDDVPALAGTEIKDQTLTLKAEC